MIKLYRYMKQQRLSKYRQRAIWGKEVFGRITFLKQ